MNFKSVAVFAFLSSALFFACTVSKQNTVNKTIYISSETRPCTAGAMETNCMLIKWDKAQPEWENFYDQIEGFTFEKGYEYEIIVSQQKIENPPADASSIQYKLVKVVSKEKSNMDSHNSENSIDWNGTYYGVVPCADCDGIEMELALNLDNTYVLTTNYLGKKKSKPLMSKGKFRWQNGDVVILEGIKEAPSAFKVMENRLLQLDMEGKKIEGQLSDSYFLNKNGNSMIEEKRWKLVELFGKPVGGTSTTHYIIFHPDRNEIEAKAGCNMMGLPYKITNTFSLQVKQGRSTMMACPDMLESELLDALLKADNITGNETTLSINKARMAPLARFELAK